MATSCPFQGLLSDLSCYLCLTISSQICLRPFLCWLIWGEKMWEKHVLIVMICNYCKGTRQTRVWSSFNILCKGGEALLQQADGLPPGARPAALSACGGPLPQQREETPLHSRVILKCLQVDRGAPIERSAHTNSHGCKPQWESSSLSRGRSLEVSKIEGKKTIAWAIKIKALGLPAALTFL